MNLEAVDRAIKAISVHEREVEGLLASMYPVEDGIDTTKLHHNDTTTVRIREIRADILTPAAKTLYYNLPKGVRVKVGAHGIKDVIVEGYTKYNFTRL